MHLANSDGLDSLVLASSWEQSAAIIYVAMPGSVIKAAPEQLRHRTAEEKETDRVVLRDLRRTADVLRESGSAKNLEDITEQDWPDGDLNSTAEDMEPNQEMSESQLPSRRLMRKTPPSGVDEKHPDPRIEHVGQTPVDAPLQPTAKLETTFFASVRTSVETDTRNHVQNSHASESECIHHHYQCQFRPLHFHDTWLRQFNRSVSLWKILKMRKRK